MFLWLWEADVQVVGVLYWHSCYTNFRKNRPCSSKISNFLIHTPPQPHIQREHYDHRSPIFYSITQIKHPTKCNNQSQNLLLCRTDTAEHVLGITMPIIRNPSNCRCSLWFPYECGGGRVRRRGRFVSLLFEWLKMHGTTNPKLSVF